MWTSASWVELEFHSTLTHPFIWLWDSRRLYSPRCLSLPTWFFLLIPCSESIFVLSFHLVGTCSPIPSPCKCLGLLVLPNCAHYLFTCLLPPCTGSSSSGHRSCFPLSPQCLVQSLELIGLLNKFEDFFPTKWTIELISCGSTLQILESA